MSLDIDAPICIIVTSFKNPPYLRECLLSLQKQTFSDFKVLVVDDCSPIEMYEFVSDIFLFDKRFSFSKQSTNIGGPSIFRKALKLVNSKYIMWLHHDDFLDQDFLAKSFQALERNPDCKFAYCLCSRVVDGVSRPEFPTAVRPDLPSGCHDLSYDTVINCWIMWSSALIRTAALKEVGGLDHLYARHDTKPPKSVYRSGESDLYTFARLSSLGPTFVLNERLCFYRDHLDANTRNPSLVQTHIQDNVRTYDYIYDDIEYFAEDVRVVAKINSIGRLMNGEGIGTTAVRLLYNSLLGAELHGSRKKIILKLREVLDRFILDDEAQNYPSIFHGPQIQILDQIIKMDP